MITESLTQEEFGLLKDILKIIGRDDELNMRIAQSVGIEQDAFDVICDETFEKLRELS